MILLITLSSLSRSRIPLMKLFSFLIVTGTFIPWLCSPLICIRPFSFKAFHNLGMVFVDMMLPFLSGLIMYFILSVYQYQPLFAIIQILHQKLLAFQLFFLLSKREPKNPRGSCCDTLQSHVFASSELWLSCSSCSYLFPVDVVCHIHAICHAASQWEEEVSHTLNYCTASNLSLVPLSLCLQSLPEDLLSCVWQAVRSNPDQECGLLLQSFE